MIATLEGKEVFGAFPNGAPNPQSHLIIAQACAAILLSSPANGKIVAMTMKPRWPVPEGIIGKFIELLESDTELVSALSNDYLPKALEDESFAPSPTVRVAVRGLESVQGALELSKEGASARFVIIE